MGNTLVAWIKREGLLVAGLLGVGVIVGLLLSDAGALDSKVFFNERVLLEPGKGVYAMRGLSEEDHVFGSIDAPIVLVEYSDLECPYCKTFSSRMSRLVEEYKGELAVVFRHHPLDHRYPRSRREAEATECAAEIGGNDGFWRYLRRLYEVTPSNDGLDPALLPEIAEYVSIDREAFSACLASGRFSGKVQADLEDAVRGGLLVTPSSVVFYGDGKRALVIGSQSDTLFRDLFTHLLSL